MMALLTEMLELATAALALPALAMPIFKKAAAPMVMGDLRPQSRETH